MLRIKIKDFQSIKQADLEVRGFTVITGPNNSGKTAVIRAVRGALSNAGGASFVRHGAKHTSVTLEFPEGGTVTWQKGNRGINRYSIDGKPFDNVGRAVPDEVGDKGIFPIQVGDKKLWPQIASQIVGQVFLLDEMGWVIAEAISDVTRVSALNKALKRSESDRRSAESELKIRKQDEQKLLEELRQFDGFEAVEEITRVLEKQVKYGNKIVTALERLEWLRGQMVQARRRVDRYEGIEEIDVPTDERVQRLQKMERTIDYLESLSGQMAAKQGEIRRYEQTLEGAVDLDLSEQEDRANRAAQAIRRLEDTRQRFVAAVDDVAHLEGVLTDKEAQLSKVNRAIKQILGDLEECPVCGSVVVEET